MELHKIQINKIWHGVVHVVFSKQSRWGWPDWKLWSTQRTL